MRYRYRNITKRQALRRRQTQAHRRRHRHGHGAATTRDARQLQSGIKPLADRSGETEAERECYYYNY